MKFRVVLTKPTGYVIVDSEDKEDYKFEFFQNGMIVHINGEQIPETLHEYSKHSQVKYIIFGYMRREISDIMVENG